jgi:hypothetical protein
MALSIWVLVTIFQGIERFSRDNNSMIHYKLIHLDKSDQANCQVNIWKKTKIQLVSRQHKEKKKLDRLMDKNVAGYKKD